MYTYPLTGTSGIQQGRSTGCKTCADTVGPPTPVFGNDKMQQKKKTTQVTQNRTTRNSVTMDISPARFKSQMICSNQNKSHLVIFSARFIMLVFVVCGSERKRDRQRGLAIVIQ